jgi:hypothetical protein
MPNGGTFDSSNATLEFDTIEEDEMLLSAKDTSVIGMEVLIYNIDGHKRHSSS